MLQWYQFDGWICTHRINPFYRGKVKLCKMCKIDYETIQEFLSFSFHYNNMDLLVDRAAEVLKNPIAVFDKNYYTVSYSDTTDVQDEVWTAGKKRGYCLFEYAAMLHGVESMRGTPLPFQIFDDWGPHRRRICPLISNSLTIGYLSVLEYHTAFDAVPGEIYDLVAGVLVKELTIEQAIRLSHQHDSAEMLLSSILNEGFANRALFLQRILGTVFEQAGPYSLIGINMHAFSSRVSGERHFKARLGTIFPKAWSLFFREYVVLLVECGKSRQIPQDGLQQLEGYLSEHDLCAGISDTFSDLYEIRRYFNQAAMAEKMARISGSDARIAQYDDYRLWRLAASIPAEQRTDYVSAFLRNLMAYDIDNQSDYVKALFIYLKNGQSLALTAQELHVHRNTVVYRIEKMRERFGGVFDSPYHNFQNFFGCLLLLTSDGQPGSTDYFDTI